MAPVLGASGGTGEDEPSSRAAGSGLCLVNLDAWWGWDAGCDLDADPAFGSGRAERAEEHLDSQASVDQGDAEADGVSGPTDAGGESAPLVGASLCDLDLPTGRGEPVGDEGTGRLAGEFLEALCLDGVCEQDSDGP